MSAIKSITYFGLYGRAETSRMCLWKAGVKHEDCKIEFKDWPALKPTTEFGSMPFVTLEDGTQIGQSIPMQNYVAARCNLMPTDPSKRYCGEKCFEFIWGDIASQILPMLGVKGDDLKAAQKKVCETIVPKFVAGVEKCLGDTKWLCGEEMCVYDMALGGIFCNMFGNKLCEPAYAME